MRLRLVVAPRLIRILVVLNDRQKNAGKISLDYCSIFESKLSPSSMDFLAAAAWPPFPTGFAGVFPAAVTSFGYAGATIGPRFFFLFGSSTISGLAWRIVTSKSPHSAVVNLLVTYTANSVLSKRFAAVFTSFSETRPVMFDFKSKTSAAACTLLSFLFVKNILAVTESLTRELNFTRNLYGLFGSMTNVSSESIEKSGCPSIRTQ